MKMSGLIKIVNLVQSRLGIGVFWRRMGFGFFPARRPFLKRMKKIVVENSTRGRRKGYSLLSGAQFWM